MSVGNSGKGAQDLDEQGSGNLQMPRFERQIPQEFGLPQCQVLRLRLRLQGLRSGAPKIEISRSGCLRLRLPFGLSLADLWFLFGFSLVSLWLTPFGFFGPGCSFKSARKW